MIPYLLACAAIGYMEAILFHVAHKYLLDAFNRDFKDIHRHFVVVRAVLFFWATGFSLDTLLYILPCALMFPLWHDGVYYIARHYFAFRVLNVKKFTAHSTTTSAKNSYVFADRVMMFLAGLVLWQSVNFLKNIV